MTYSGRQKPGMQNRQECRSTACPASSNEEAERALLLKALNQQKGNITKAAESVGYTREMFLMALRQHGFGEVM